MRIYISSDYSPENGDREVVEELMRFNNDRRYALEFVDMAQVASGSVSVNNPDCRPCDLKREFNHQINASSVVIFVVGDKTAVRTAGSTCNRMTNQYGYATCTPYKQNANGTKMCKVYNVVSTKSSTTDDVGSINSYSYLEHEFKQAVKKEKQIIIFYNAKIKRESWLPTYMRGYENLAQPFWIDTCYGPRGNYEYLKQVLL